MDTHRSAQLLVLLPLFTPPPPSFSPKIEPSKEASGSPKAYPIIAAFEEQHLHPLTVCLKPPKNPRANGTPLCLREARTKEGAASAAGTRPPRASSGFADKPNDAAAGAAAEVTHLRELPPEAEALDHGLPRSSDKAVRSGAWRAQGGSRLQSAEVAHPGAAGRHGRPPPPS